MFDWMIRMEVSHDNLKSCNGRNT